MRNPMVYKLILQGCAKEILAPVCGVFIPYIFMYSCYVEVVFLLRYRPILSLWCFSFNIPTCLFIFKMFLYCESGGYSVFYIGYLEWWLFSVLYRLFIVVVGFYLHLKMFIQSHEHIHVLSEYYFRLVLTTVGRTLVTVPL